MKDDEIKLLLESATDQVGPLRAAPNEELTRRVAGRRRAHRRRVMIGGAAAILSAGALAALIWNPLGSPDASDSAAADAPTSAPQEPGPFTCGKPIPFPTTDRVDGFSVALTSVQRSAAGPAHVTFTINAPEAVGLEPTEVYPTVLLLRDGVVVGGPIPQGGVGPGRPLRYPLWSPRFGWPVVEQQTMQSWLCGTTDWDEVWVNPGRYELALVMSPPSTVTEAEPPSPRSPTGPLLMAASRLDLVTTEP